MDKYEQPTDFPKPFSPGLYGLLAAELFTDGTPVLYGGHAYFHLNHIRNYGGMDHLCTLQIIPRLPADALDCLRALKSEGKNVAVVDMRQPQFWPPRPFDDAPLREDEAFNMFDPTVLTSGWHYRTRPDSTEVRGRLLHPAKPEAYRFLARRFAKGCQAAVIIGPHARLHAEYAGENIPTGTKIIHIYEKEQIPDAVKSARLRRSVITYSRDDTTYGSWPADFFVMNLASNI